MHRPPHPIAPGESSAGSCPEADTHDHPHERRVGPQVVVWAPRIELTALRRKRSLPDFPSRRDFRDVASCQCIRKLEHS